MKILNFLLIIFPIIAFSQNLDYKISSFMNKGNKAPNTHHIGDAWLNFLVQADDDFKYNITQATFSPNSTLDWHKHSTPQVIIIVDGKGYYQERGKEVIVLKKGDIIKCEKGIEHWHTSTPENEVSYIAIYGNEPTIWTEKLSEEYYKNVGKKLKESKNK